MNVAIVTARAGSKSIIDKNILPVIGQPMVQYPIKAAQAAKRIAEVKVSTERQSYPKAYYYDQGVWAFRKGTVQVQDGPNPWWWMGKNVHPIIRPWVTGRDIHDLIDVFFSEQWVRHPDVVNKIREGNK